jgi:hypothetical protein
VPGTPGGTQVVADFLVDVDEGAPDGARTYAGAQPRFFIAVFRAVTADVEQVPGGGDPVEVGRAEGTHARGTVTAALPHPDAQAEEAVSLDRHGDAKTLALEFVPRGRAGPRRCDGAQKQYRSESEGT